MYGNLSGLVILPYIKTLALWMRSKINMINKNTFILEIKQILEQARQNAYSAVNTAMVESYWLVGKRIVEEEQQGEQKAAYGEAILKNLSIALTAELGKGFSYANLRNFRQFYLTYPDPEICYALRSKLTWSHNQLIMRVEDAEARRYYLQEATEQSWLVQKPAIFILISYFIIICLNALSSLI
jgi:predicted nuclease of restriction endonuclease-like (RecB) superfamily